MKIRKVEEERLYPKEGGRGGDSLKLNLERNTPITDSLVCSNTGFSSSANNSVGIVAEYLV